MNAQRVSVVLTQAEARRLRDLVTKEQRDTPRFTPDWYRLQSIEKAIWTALGCDVAEEPATLAFTPKRAG